VQLDDECRAEQRGFDPRDEDGLCLREVLACGGHELRNPAGGQTHPAAGRPRRLDTPLPCRPFSDHPKAAAKPGGAEPAPQLRTISAARGPLSLQKRQQWVQAVFADKEHVFALAADDPTDQAAAEPGRAHDPLDRDALVGHVPDHPVDLLPTLKAFVLKPFGLREQPRVENGGTDGAVDSRHLSPHGGEKGCACVLEKMPAIGDLECLWQGTRDCAGIAPVAVAGHDLYLGLRPRSGLDSCRLPVGPKIDDLPPFEVADQRAVPLAASPCPVIDADYGRLADRRLHRVADAALDSIFANRQEKPAGERLARDRGILTCAPVHAHAAVMTRRLCGYRPRPLQPRLFRRFRHEPNSIL
jgi:hypothetical protein